MAAADTLNIFKDEGEWKETKDWIKDEMVYAKEGSGWRRGTLNAESRHHVVICFDDGLFKTYNKPLRLTIQRARDMPLSYGGRNFSSRAELDALDNDVRENLDINELCLQEICSTFTCSWEEAMDMFQSEATIIK